MTVEIARRNLSMVKQQVKLAKLILEAQVLAGRLKKKNDTINRYIEAIEEELQQDVH